MTHSLAEEISRLPATPAITYRGMSGAPATAAFTISAVLPTSLDPRVASENFTADRLAAIVTITGRYIAPLSRHPDEHEIAILPGTMLLPVGFVAVHGLPNEVVLLAEPGSAEGLPPDADALRAAVSDRVTAALAGPAIEIRSPGRFTPG